VTKQTGDGCVDVRAVLVLADRHHVCGGGPDGDDQLDASEVFGFEGTPEMLEAIESAMADAELGSMAYLDSDWDVRFRRDIFEEPDWLDDAPFSDEPPDDCELAETPRGASGGRPSGWRRRRFDPPADPRKMVGDKRFLSRSFATAAEYVDVFGPVVTAPHRRDIWPDVMVVDSLPLRRRTRADTNENARGSSDFLCEIVAVVDGTDRELISLYPADGKDRESLKEVFATKKGSPSWIVTDGDPAAPFAIEAAFPNAIHYRCEDHLRKDVEEAAKADRITNSGVLVAIENAQRSPAHWEALKATVEAHVPAGLPRLRDWIRRNDDLVLHQCVLRQEHPDKPRSSGSVENHLARASPRMAAVRERTR